MRKRARIAAAIALAVVAVAAPAGAEATPAATSANIPGGLIAFIREVPTHPCCPYDLFTVRSNGQGLRRLTHGQHITSFAWGPSGRHLLYSNGHGIWIVAWDGSQPTRLVGRDHPGADEPVWSPDGKKFLFFTHRDDLIGAEQPRVYTFADHRVTTVDHPANGAYYGASWSPDSRNLVFSAPDGNIHRYQLWTDSLATGAVQQLTSFRRGEAGGALYPAWSPDGDRIVFVLDVVRDQGGTELTNLWSVAPDGTDLHQITFSPRHGEHQAAWSPNRNQFVDASSSVGDYSLPSDYTALVVRRADGTTIRRIHAHGDMLPSWSANGRWLVAIRLTYGGTGGDIAKNPGLWIMRADGTDAHRALKTRLLADFFPPEWEPRPG